MGPRRGRPGRRLLRQPAQVAGHRDGLQRPAGRRPGRAHRRDDHLAALPARVRPDPAAVDHRDRRLPLGHRSRALKLWFVLRWYGAEGLRAHPRRGVALADRFAEHVRADDRFAVVGAPPVRPGALPPARRRRHQRGPPAPRQRHRRAAAQPHRGARPPHVADGHRRPGTTAGHIDTAWRRISAAADELRAPRPARRGRAGGTPR
ncbi:pyridoxal-dependent decarboxylase [Actinosynnema sp. NPDC053489]|uniref:pyridoxal-dependent decarboxylase n=1 Tax=Actinosynnema sp. NPDC053489 TaxID=3363916 RepID=UPI0037CA904D